MTEPTEGEWRQALSVVGQMHPYRLASANRYMVDRQADAVIVVAHALADQRARYEAVADSFRPFYEGKPWDEVASAYCDAADRIRQVSSR